MVIAMESPVKAFEVKRSPWSIQPRTLVKPILLLALLGGLALGLLIAAYHPVMGLSRHTGKKVQDRL